MSFGHGCRKPLDDWLEQDRGYKTPCWVWQGYITKDGYAQRTGLVHRKLYEQRHSISLQGAELDHLCRVRCCVNPDHLEPVTHQENMWRGSTTKLTPEKAELMRRVKREANLTAAQLAKAFNVGETTVRAVVNYRIWV